MAKADKKSILITGFESFEDDSDAPFYRSLSRNLSPSETWNAIHGRLIDQLKAVEREVAIQPVRMTPERLVKWHRALFQADFPVEAGTFRRGSTYYPVTYVERGKRVRLQVEGVAPKDITRELQGACDRFNEAIEAARDRGGQTEMHAAALVAAQLYAEILAVHPFEDGNGRTAFVALQAALRSQGLWMVNFQGKVRLHDECLGWALRPDDKRDCRPFADLLIQLIKDSTAPGSGTIKRP